ncbi:MAG: dihydrolipoyl dehydrogenase [Cyclobacteriaceae bacterium]|nr:dihydrolipoyl dehydrogenase [Cyclobacteriaceae bacterium]
MAEEDKIHQLVVVGAGPGGYAAAFRASDLGMKVTLIDPRENPGGVCLYEGCIPTKALLHVSQLRKEAYAAKEIGISFKSLTVESKKIREWKNRVVSDMTEGLGQLAKQRKVNHIRGTARFIRSNELEINHIDDKKKQKLTFEHAIIATGSRPVSLPGINVSGEFIMDSNEALEIRESPERLLVIGAGYIGLEMSAIYHMLGSVISLVEMKAEILPGTDRDLVKVYEKENREMFNEIFLESKVISAEKKDGSVDVKIETPEGEITRSFDKILVSVGREPVTDNLGLENTDVKTDDNKFIRVDEFRKTDDDHIYAIGDVTGEPLLAHKATHEGIVAAEVLSGKKTAFEPNAIPAVIYTDPEIAWVGMTEDEARSKHFDVEVSKFPWGASGRAKTLQAKRGITKLVIDKKTERILGVAIAGKNAGELIAEGALAIEMAAVASDLSYTIHPHPTLSETMMEAAEAFYGLSINIYKPKK